MTEIPPERLRRMEGLAAAVLGGDVRVEPGATWAWSPARRVITVPPGPATEQPIEHCLAIAFHEIGHGLATRPEVPIDSEAFDAALSALDPRMRRRLRHQIHNALEDPRVERAIGDLLPGAAALLNRVRADQLTRLPPTAELGQRRSALPSLEAFLYYHIEELLRGAPTPDADAPFGVGPALAATRPARLAYTACLPRPTSVSAEAAQAAANTHFAREILPAAARLHRSDLRRLQGWINVDPRRRSRLRAAAERGRVWLARMLAQALRATGSAEASDPGCAPGPLVIEALDRYYADRRRPPRQIAVTARCVDGGDLGRGKPTEDTRPRPSRARKPARRRRGPRVDYPTLRGRVAPQIERLISDLQTLLRPTRMGRLTPGFSSGPRVHRRRLVRHVAGARGTPPDFFQRRVRPSARDAAVSLLVDLSGSMRSGRKAIAAAEGTVVLVEALHRLGIPVAVTGFQREPIPLVAHGAPLDASARRAIAGIPNRVGGVNDDAKCVSATAARLFQVPADLRVLITISDGQPSGRPDAGPALLRTTERLSRRRDLVLVGLGLGPDTEHVREFYADARGDIPPDRIAAEISASLRRSLRRLTAHERL